MAVASSMASAGRTARQVSETHLRESLEIQVSWSHNFKPRTPTSVISVGSVGDCLIAVAGLILLLGCDILYKDLQDTTSLID
jgi:hypothetical protein